MPFRGTGWFFLTVKDDGGAVVAIGVLKMSDEVAVGAIVDVSEILDDPKLVVGAGIGLL